MKGHSIWGKAWLIFCTVVLVAWCVGFGLWLLLAPVPAGILCC